MPDIEQHPITRDNLNDYLKELGKEFRKLNGTKATAEIVLVGGAAVLAKYDFRNLTYDVDAIIETSASMKDTIRHVGNKHGLPNGWLNTDFIHTESYTVKLREVSVFYRTFSNILHIRTIAAEYLLAMKLKSSRPYKNDLSDIVGIMWEHQKRNEPLKRESIEKAFITLYGADATITQMSHKLLESIFAEESLEILWESTRKNEIKAKNLLLGFEQQYPNMLNADNIDRILENAKKRMETTSTIEPLLSKLEEAKRKSVQIKQDDISNQGKE